MFQGISHEKTGLADLELHKVWFQFMESLQTNCGPCFLQLPPHFSYEWKAVLFKFLQSWSKEFQLAIEFREKQGLPNVYFFMHEPDDILLPEMMTHLKELPFFKSHFSPSDLKIESEAANLKFFT